MKLFSAATLSPVFLILAAAGWGGVWAWLAVGALTLLAFSLDRLTPEEIVNANPEAEFPASTALLVGLAIAHLALVPVAILAIAGPGALSPVDRTLLGTAVTLFFGQISHPVAHELIHRSNRHLRLLGQIIYSSMFFGHHASAHLRVHHVHVGSLADPNSARLGQDFYNFVLHAWPAGFMTGLRAENHLRQERAHWRHPYVFYLSGALSVLIGAYLLAGAAGVATVVLLNAYAQLQILMSDYVQHYGLRRHVLADGRFEPVGPQHSWNAPHWYTSAMSLNAPRHSDHHVTPSRPYPALQLDEEKMPCLPFSLPVMAGIALVPPLWRKIMDPRCERWQPLWIERSSADARNISPAVLARAKPGGAATPGLPDLDHANEFTDPVPQRHRG